MKLIKSICLLSAAAASTVYARSYRSPATNRIGTTGHRWAAGIRRNTTIGSELPDDVFIVPND